MQILPKRLLREISSIIVGTVYHPPSSCDFSMRNYLCESMSSLEARFPNCGLLLLGDFNKLNLSHVANAFGVKRVVPFPTRRQSKLDLVFSNHKAYYDTPGKLSPLDFLIMPLSKFNPWKGKSFLLRRSYYNQRDLRATNRLAMRTYLEEVDVCSLVGSLVSCQQQTDTLETAIETGMDILLPLNPKIVMSNDPPWINKQMKSLIKQREVSFTRGDLV